MTRNPLREMREGGGLTLEALAYEAELSKPLIIKAEQGLYQRPPPSLLFYLCNLTGEDPNEVRDKYYEYQASKRRSNGANSERPILIEPFPVGQIVNHPESHPFALWRSLSPANPSLYEVTTTLCVNHAIMHKFEKMPWQVKRIPGQLIEALNVAGYSNDSINNLQVCYDSYKAYRRTHPSLKAV